jgi:hypothetical protein
MAYIFTAITGGQNVGQAFTRVNQNLAAIEDNQGNITGDFLPLSGGTLNANAVIKLPNTGSFNTLSLSANSINFYDDNFSSNINIKPNWITGTEAAINVIDTLADGYMVIVPTPSGEGGKDIRVNASGNGWEYIDLDAKFLQLTGGILTGSLSGTTFALGEGSYFNTLSSVTLSANRIVNLPNASGTIALEGNYVKNTGDTITGLYTINDGPVDGAKIDIIGTTPILYLEGDSPVVRLISTDVVSKSQLYSSNLSFDNNGIGSAASVLTIQPSLSTTGTSTLQIIKLTGNTSGYIPSVGDISTRPNEFIKVNNNGTGFNFGTLSGAGTVSVTSSVNGWTISGATSSGPSGGGVTGVTSAGTGNILLLSGTVVNNNLIQKSLLAGSGIGITESNGTITISGSGGSSSFTGITSASTVGGGVSLISAITSNNLQLNSLSGTAGMVVNAASNGLVTFRGPNTANRVFMTDASGNMVNSDFLFTDNTNDTLGINVAAATTARLLISTQTAAIAPLRFTKSATDYTGAIDGSLWYLTAGDSLKFRKNTTTTDFIFKDNNNTLTGISNNRVVQADSAGTLSANISIVNFGIFNMVTSVTITNTTSETSILNTGATALIGTNIINSSVHATAPQLVAGKKFRFSAKGEFQTKNSAAGTFNVKIKLGSSIISTSSAFTLSNNLNTPNIFGIESTFTVRSQGASGKVIGSGFINSDETFHTGGQDVYALFNQGAVTIDTTTDKVFDCTVQFGTADATNTLTINEATLEYLN